MVDRMLYEFHRQQNGKKPGTVHATYLISGTKRVDEPESTPTIKKDGEDEYMQSSPFMNSSMPQVDDGTGASSILTITLTREEDLESMSPGPNKPIQTDPKQKSDPSTNK
jgi:DNA polymerase delta subunit 3